MNTTETWEPAGKPTPEQVKFFNDNGYLKYGRIFTKQEMDELAAYVDKKIANLPPGARPEGMDVPHFTDPSLFKYLADPRVLDVIEEFIGPDIVLWSSHFIAKPKGDGKMVPWHTDGVYWNTRLTPMRVITMWLAVDDSTTENGCMRVIPGSHLEFGDNPDNYIPVDSRINVFDAEIKPELIDESKTMDLELNVGECHFHDAFTVDGSRPNHSDKRRCGYTMRYMPANNVFNHKNTGFKIYLLRGQDRTGGKNDYAPVPEWKE